MKILLIHRYFWPDSPPYASMLRSLATSLAAEGHDVSVYTAQPSYGSTRDHESRPRTEKLGSVAVRRARLVPESKTNVASRLVNLLAFAVQAAVEVRRSRPEVVLAATTPPVLVAAATTMAASTVSASSIYHCQDIYPEVAIASGIMRQGLIARFLRRVDTATMRRADRIVVLSKDMAETVCGRDPSLEAKIRIVNNFAVESFESESDAGTTEVVLPTGLERSAGVSRVVFAGNLGNFQGLDNVILAARHCHDNPTEFGSIEWLFVGRGQAQQRLEELAGPALGSTVRFAGHWPAHVAERAVSESDLALVSLSPGVISAAFPSKTLMYLSAGTPIAVVAEPESELATVVASEGLGFVVAPGRPEALAEAVRDYMSGNDLAVVGDRCRDYGIRETSRDLQLGKWNGLIGELAPPRHVFLLGAARSGTKFLRDTLAASNDVAVIPYDINYVWRHGNEHVPDDALRPHMLTEATRRHIRASVHRLATTGAHRPVILEKSVSNSLRVDVIRDVFPDAKLIYLERDGRDVTESAHRQWTAPNDGGYLLKKLRYFPIREWRYAIWFARNTLQRSRPAIWGPRYPGIDEDMARFPLPVVCAKQWRASVEAWHSRVPNPGLEIEVEYRDLFEDPVGELTRLCEFAGISDIDRVIDSFNRTARPVFGSWPGVLSSSDQSQIAAIIDAPFPGQSSHEEIRA